MTSRDRWGAILQRLHELETMLDAIAVDPKHRDWRTATDSSEHVTRATSMAGFAVDGYGGVDPPPRGASRQAWREAYEHLRYAKDPALRTLVVRVRAILK